MGMKQWVAATPQYNYMSQNITSLLFAYKMHAQMSFQKKKALVSF